MKNMDKKQQIRKDHILKRNGLLDAEVSRLSEKICIQVKEFLDKKKDLKKCGVYGYYPHGKEVSLLGLYAWLLSQNVPLAFPKTTKDAMEFYLVSSMEGFAEGRFHIMEPKSCRRADFAHAVCLTPGSVFDRGLNRYGYGKGYYDRYFSVHTNLYRLGIAYESQMEETIPAGEYDMKMHAVATEAGIYFME